MTSSPSQYHRFGLLAQGQFGKVYCALHRSTGRMVALKVLDSQRSPTATFLRELSTVLALRHPNLVQLYGVENHPHQRYLILDYCEGGTLRQLIEAAPMPRPQLLLQLIIDLLSGLDHTHQRGIVHCDVKPENILLTLTSRGWSPKLTDFGIAHNQSLPKPACLGSPAYMAPEYFEGEISPGVDLYAVGIIVYELLLGRRPFQGAPDQLRLAHCHQIVPLPQSLPQNVGRFLQKALAKQPQRRFTSAPVMAAALRQLQGCWPPSADHLFPAIALTPKRVVFQLQPSAPDMTEVDMTEVDGTEGDMTEVDGTEAPDGSWAAKIMADPHPQLLCYRRGRWTKATPLPPPMADAIAPPSVLILDPRHGLVWSVSTQNTQLVLFNRRGSWLSPIMMAVPVRLMVPLVNTPRNRHPLQLLALEQQRPQVLLKISLRPFRLQRIPLALTPVALVALSWGMVAADQQGQLLLLTHEGQVLALIAPPAVGSFHRLWCINDWEVAIALRCGSDPHARSQEPSHQPRLQISHDQLSTIHTYRLCLTDLDLEIIF